MVIVERDYSLSRRRRTKGKYSPQFWLVKEGAVKSHTRGEVFLGVVYFPGVFIGRRVRFKVEVLDDPHTT